ncbi:unnamed protein product [Amoebophrya sp. A120]|nr:unnamed protein product [Amoebophrya sp. A120]|eukprot:GSA120T00025926001.1
MTGREELPRDPGTIFPFECKDEDECQRVLMVAETWGRDTKNHDCENTKLYRAYVHNKDAKDGNLSMELLEVPEGLLGKKLKKLGEGGYGTVYEVQEKFAVKRMEFKRNYTYNECVRMQREINAMTVLKHPNFIRQCGVWTCGPGAGIKHFNIFIVMLSNHAKISGSGRMQDLSCIFLMTHDACNSNSNS